MFGALLGSAAMCAGVAHGFYLPGMAPRYYKTDDRVDVLVNAFQSTRTALPFDYYEPRLHMCAPEELRSEGENLGSVLMGDRLYNSPIALTMMKDEQCHEVCRNQAYSSDDAVFLKQLIQENYLVNWDIDGLPAARKEVNLNTGEEIISPGFELGEDDGVVILNNHQDITINVFENKDGSYTITKVLVSSRSVSDSSKCSGDVVPVDEKGFTTGFSYSVTWVKSSDPWGTRWNSYLHVVDPQIHWLSLINSFVIVLFLTGMVAMILLRALHRDIARYNKMDDQEEAQEDFGWKLIHGDIFRPPSRANWLCVFVGSGAQVFVSAGVTLFFALLGFLSPSSRGSLVTAMVVTYVLLGVLAGYVSSIFYKSMGGENWKRNVLATAFTVPGIIFTVFFILNFFLISAKSSAAVPFGTFCALIALWFLISVPTCFVGAYFGFKRPKFEYPVRTNQIPRQVPEQPFHLRAWPSYLMGGVLPFGAIFIELFFIMTSIWSHQLYYVFGFLFLVFIILILTCSQVTILMCYFHLCAEDYHWWWRSFFTSGASALYLFLYSILYFHQTLDTSNVVSSVMYFGYTLVFTFIFFLLTGFIGFVACFWFVRKIYASIKID